jgi:hypothetical protein
MGLEGSNPLLPQREKYQPGYDGLPVSGKPLQPSTAVRVL